jgi:Ricin-type beta-trefoil lectin domain
VTHRDRPGPARPPRWHSRDQLDQPQLTPWDDDLSSTTAGTRVSRSRINPRPPSHRYVSSWHWRTPIVYTGLLVAAAVVVSTVLAERDPAPAARSAAPDRPTLAAPPASTSATPSPSPSLSPSLSRTAPVPSRRASATGRPFPPARRPSSPAPPAATATIGIITSASGACLDDASSGTADGNPIQVWQCNQTPAQMWTVATDGTLRVFGKCMRVGTDGVSDGAPIVLWDCDGSAEEIWRGGANASLVNPASGKCLDDPSGGTGWGYHLQLLTCGGGDGQRWTLPSGP